MTLSIEEQLKLAGAAKSQRQAKQNLVDAANSRLMSRGISSDSTRHAYYVPGRIEFLGKHTDYAGGRSLICAVDRGFCIIATPRNDAIVRILGESADADFSFELKPDLIPTAGHWSNYPMTVGRRIAQNFPGSLKGADISFTSDLPQSSGLSSSSAMIIAFFFALAGVNQLEQRPEYLANIQTRTDLAGYLGTIENGQNFGSLIGDRGVGTFGGSEDHTAIITGVAGELSQYSFCPVRFERRVPLPEDYSLVIGVSGVIAEKTGAAQSLYNNASLAARAVLDRWRSSTGRSDVTLAEAVSGEGSIEQIRRLLADPNSGDPLLIDRLDQFISESTQIIPAAGDALIARNLDELGILVDRSQELARRLLKNQVPETVQLARSARELGAVAASSFGAGFGGSVWAMVRSTEVDSFISHWKQQYHVKFPEPAQRAAFFQANAGVSAMQLHV